MLAAGCLRFPTLSVDVPMSIPFQPLKDNPQTAALLNSSSSELRALHVGRAYRVTVKGLLGNFHFLSQYLYAPFVDFAIFKLTHYNRITVRNEIPFAYLLQHDRCADTSFLEHADSVVLQVCVLDPLHSLRQSNPRASMRDMCLFDILSFILLLLPSCFLFSVTHHAGAVDAQMRLHKLHFRAWQHRERGQERALGGAAAAIPWHRVQLHHPA